MKFDRLAGTASAVGILLIVVIVIAAAEPGFKLQKWQIFMAAMVALGAAVVAYKGAIGAATLTYQGNIAKVDLDRTIAERERRSKKLGLFLRLYLTLGTLQFEIERSLKSIDSFAQALEEGPLRKSDLSLSDVAELNEAWEKLDLFPLEAIEDINRIRNLLPKIKKALDEVFDSKPGTITPRVFDPVISKPVDYETSNLLRTHKEDRQYARQVVMNIQQVLSREIDELRIDN
jgi:hypothetical protein